MQNFWRRPFAMIEQLDRSVRAGYLKKPVYYDAMMREKPTQEYYVQSDLPRSRKVFREDVWRKWYYSKYPEEKETFSEDDEPRIAEKRFYKTPVDQFIERMSILVDRGHKRPQVAFHLAVMDKEFRNQTAIIEQQVTHDQAVHLFNLPEALWRERASSIQEVAYSSAKDSLLRNKTGKIGYLVQLKQEAGDDTKIRSSQLLGLTREQILKFIDDHPGSAKYFHESLFSRELAKAMEKIKATKDPLPLTGRVGERGVLQDFESSELSDAEIQAEKLLQKMSADLNIDTESPQLARLSSPQRLVHAARIYYQQTLENTMREYLRNVMTPNAATGTTEARSEKAISSEIDKLFEEFNKSLAR